MNPQKIILLLVLCMIIAGPVTAADQPEAAEANASCAIYIYMCGSNLESKFGFATRNIDELLEADIPENTNVLIQTGGTSRWWSAQNIAADRLQRYAVRDHELVLLEELENASMGDADTFGSFLT